MFQAFSYLRGAAALLAFPTTNVELVAVTKELINSNFKTVGHFFTQPLGNYSAASEV